MIARHALARLVTMVVLGWFQSPVFAQSFFLDQLYDAVLNNEVVSGTVCALYQVGKRADHYTDCDFRISRRTDAQVSY